eukprot:179797-Prorocentrum_minimum.AAC.4
MSFGERSDPYGLKFADKNNTACHLAEKGLLGTKQMTTNGTPALCLYAPKQMELVRAWRGCTL